MRQEGGPLYPTISDHMWLPLERRHKPGQGISSQGRSVLGWGGEPQELRGEHSGWAAGQ